MEVYCDYHLVSVMDCKCLKEQREMINKFLQSREGKGE
jgi:hypothetical protein